MFVLSGFADEISPDLDQQLAVLKEEDINYLELRGVWNKNVADLTDEEAKKVKTELTDAGIKVSAIGSPIGKVNITDDFELHLTKFKRVLQLAKHFETAYIRLFSYYLPEGDNPAKYRDEVINRMKTKTELAEKEGIILLHENESRIYGNNSDRCKDIIETVNSAYLRNLFDPANFVVENENPYPGCFHKLVDYTAYLHIKDAKFAKGVHIVLPGEGDAKIKEILHDLKNRNFKGFLSLEPHLAIAGSSGGFTGPELFKKASQLLKKMLTDLNAEFI